MFVNILAQTNGEQATGGGGLINFLLPALLILLVFMMFRKNKKAQQQVQEQRTQMVPGTEVMTNSGIFGTIVSIDADENKAVLELSPGNTATVHLQALTKVVAPVAAEEEQPEVPDDASALTGEVQAPERPAETDQTDPLNRDKNKEN